MSAASVTRALLCPESVEELTLAEAYELTDTDLLSVLTQAIVRECGGALTFSVDRLPLHHGRRAACLTVEVRGPDGAKLVRVVLVHGIICVLEVAGSESALTDTYEAVLSDALADRLLASPLLA